MSLKEKLICLIYYLFNAMLRFKVQYDVSREIIKIHLYSIKYYYHKI